MKTLILDGTPKEDTFSNNINQRLLKALKTNKSSVENIVLIDHDIKSCVGCFSCFFKTPGACVFNDIVREIPQTYINSDIAIILTPVTFGGFSSILAKAYYRIAIQIELHLFKYTRGEVNRRKRYNKRYPSLIAIGIERVEDLENRKIFNGLVSANAFRNIHAPEYKTIFLAEGNCVAEIDYRLNSALSEIQKTKKNSRTN